MQQRFLLQILFLAQRVSGNTTPTAEGYVSGLQDAAASYKPDT